MIANADLVLFAIQAGVRLYAAGQKAYVEATLDRPLVLPLPDGPGITVAAAHTFFTNDSQGKLIAERAENGRVKTLIDASNNGTIDAEGERLLTQIYVAYLKELHPEAFNFSLSSNEPKGQELVAIMTIRQWSQGERGNSPTALQLVAGTLVNVAVDYFVNTPGAISDKRPAGRALKAFLTAIDGINLADAPAPEIAGDLLVAIVDSVGAHPEMIGNTETEKKLVTNVATTLSSSAKTYLKNVPTDDLWRGSSWLQMIARAVIKGGIDTVLADPKAVLGATDAEAGVIKTVGETVAGLVIGPDQLKFQALLSGNGINAVIKSAMQAVAKNPAILKVDSQGLRNIIAGVADGLSQQDNLLTGDIFPDIVSLVLEKSADNLDLLWPKSENDPAKHLLVASTRELFKALASKTHDANWPTLNKSQLLKIVEVVFDEVSDNPGWLLKKTGIEGDSTLGAAVLAAIDSLKKQSVRLSADAVASAISAAVSASAMRLGLLQKLPAGGADAGKVAISAAIDAVFESAFGATGNAEKEWVRTRNSTIVCVLEVALTKLAKIGADQKYIDVLRREIGNLIDGRLTAEELGERLEQLLKAA